MNKLLLDGAEKHFSSADLPLLVHAGDGTTDFIFVKTAADMQQASGKRVIFVGKETPELFEQLMDTLPDISERTIFFKNFDLFEPPVFKHIASMPNLVLMGDIDKCAFAEELLGKTWKTKIYFSPSIAPMDLELPQLPKYAGYLSTQHESGMITLAEDQAV